MRKDINEVKKNFQNSSMTLQAFAEREKLNVIDHFALQREVEGRPKKKKNVIKKHWKD